MLIEKKIINMLISNINFFILYKVNISLNQNTLYLYYYKKNFESNFKNEYLDSCMSPINLALRTSIIKNDKNKVDCLNRIERQINILNIWITFFIDIEYSKILLN